MPNARAEIRPVGAMLDPGGVRFRVWALGHEQVEVVLFEDDREVDARPLKAEADGYFAAFVPGLRAGARYKFRVDGAGPFPDPASRFQPEGVHGPSQVVDLAFHWRDGGWSGRPLEDLVIYELHVGTFTPDGTFGSLIPALNHIKTLGATAIELMPIGDFPGERNWGYDGVFPWATARAYGGPWGLQRLVDAAHALDLAVILDVVYNHLGPDGNYLRAYSTDYFTERHHTPWGEALNFDGPNSQPIRDFFIGNALYWLQEFHLDGLRLDATHEVQDESELHFLRELAERVRAGIPSGREVLLIAEDERNEARLVTPIEAGGIGLDGVWADDLHHQVRRALAGDSEGYYADYTGAVADIVHTLRRGWFFEGHLRPTTGERRGTPADSLPYPAFIHCIQNHDQIGNRAFGDRLNHDIDLSAYRAASVLLLLDPATPLLFMGQEWAASTPFLFFTDHNPELGALVTQGRRAEFAGFSAFADETLRDQIPDPQAVETFTRSTLKWDERDRTPHADVLRLYRDLLELRASHPALRERSRGSVETAVLGPEALALRRASAGGSMLLLIVNLRGDLALDLDRLDLAGGRDWRLALSSEATRYSGEGAAVSLAGRRLRVNGAAAVLFEAAAE